MKIVTKFYNAYTFDELSEKAKEKALQDYAENGLIYEWWDCVYEWYIEEKCPAIGLSTSEKQISFSGFWSQGDGASITGIVNIENWLKINKLSNKYRKLLNFAKQYDFEVEIYRHSSHYCHANTLSINYDRWHLEKEIEPQLDAVTTMILNEVKALSNQLYNDLQKEYEYLTSEESLNEMSIANGWQYLENGKMI